MSTHPNQALLTQAALLQAHAGGFVAGRTATTTVGLRRDRAPLGFVEKINENQQYAGSERVSILGITASGAIAVKRYGNLEFWPPSFLQLDAENGPEIKLNNAYRATFAPDGKTFKVGCQTFEADLLEGLIAFRDRVREDFAKPQPALDVTKLGATWTPPAPKAKTPAAATKTAAKKAPAKKAAPKKKASR